MGLVGRGVPLQQPVLRRAVALEGEREGIEPAAHERVLPEDVPRGTPDVQAAGGLGELACALQEGRGGALRLPQDQRGPHESGRQHEAEPPGEHDGPPMPEPERPHEEDEHGGTEREPGPS